MPLEDELSGEELTLKNRLIREGINDCKKYLKKQKTKRDFFFYDGSIDGFEECKTFSKFSHFEERIQELYNEEKREISKSSLGDNALREHLRIYNKNEKTEENEVFRLKGMKTQISFVYERLLGYRAARRIIKDNATINEDNISSVSYSSIWDS